MTQAILPSRKRLEKKNYYKATVNIRDLIKFYRNKYGTPTKGGCDPKIFRAVIHEFNEYIADRIVQGDRIVFPYDIGCIDVIKRRQKYVIEEDGKIKTDYLMVDWPKTWEYWKTNKKAAEEKKLLYYTNDHSDNFRYKFRWEKTNNRAKHARYYSFKPSRLLSRKLAEYVLNEETIKTYPELC